LLKIFLVIKYKELEINYQKVIVLNTDGIFQ